MDVVVSVLRLLFLSTGGQPKPVQKGHKAQTHGGVGG